MPKTPKLTEEARRREKNEKRDNLFRACLGAMKAVTGMTNAQIAKELRISDRTMDNRVKHPETLTLSELRRLSELMPEGVKIPAEVIGL